MKFTILRSIHFFCVLVFLTLFIGPTAGAAPPVKDPPVKEDCDRLYAENDFNNRIGCKAENANKALFDYVDSVIEFEKMSKSYGRAPLFTDTQTEHLLAARERAQNAKVRSHDAKAFRGPAKKQKAEDADCFVKEQIGDGIGDDIQPCEKNEACEEVWGDGIGNDDDECVTKGKPEEREVCEQVCQKPLPDDEDNYDSTSAFDTEQGLEELEVAFENSTVGVRMNMMQMQTYYSTSPQHLSSGECDTFEFGLFPTSLALQLAQVAKNVADMVFNSCSVTCNQDAFGWNCSAACLVFAVASGVANGIFDGFSVADDANGSAQLDRVAECTRQLDHEIAGLSSAVEGTQLAIDEVNRKVDALTTLVEEHFLVIENHLCTPQGRRECFTGHEDQ